VPPVRLSGGAGIGGIMLQTALCRGWAGAGQQAVSCVSSSLAAIGAR
jgi:hypothetical protein